MYILNIYKREFLEREIAMAYEAQGIEAVKNKLDINKPTSSLEGYINVLQSQPSAQGRVGNNQSVGDASLKGTNKQSVSNNPPAQPQAQIRKEKPIKAADMDKANQTMGKCYYSYIKGGGALNIDNPLLR